MKTTLIKLLLDARGRFVSLATGAVVAAVTKALAVKSIPLDPQIEDFVSALAGLVVMWVIDSIILKLQADGVKRIQDALPPHVESDGVPGDVTVAAVEHAASNTP